MGAGCSSFRNLEENIYLIKFTGAEVISPNDPFWNQLLSFTFDIPSTRSDYKLLEVAIADHLANIKANCNVTGNLSSLIKVFLARATELKASAQCDNTVFNWQAYNAIFIIQCIIKNFMESISEQEVFELIQSPPQHKKGGAVENRNLMEDFVTSLVEIIVDVPLTDVTYHLHYEATTMLLVSLSSHMFFSSSLSRFLVFRILMSGKSSIHACLLVKTLLNRFIAQLAPPCGQKGGSIILDLASNLWSVLTLNLASLDEDSESKVVPSLASQSVLLLLVLVNHCTTSDKVGANPYHQALLHAQSYQDPSEGTHTCSVATFKLSYGKLYNTLCSSMNEEHTALLLYLLLHKNPDFRTYILSRTEIEDLVLPLLHTLYHSPDRTSHSIYMSLIILLILSEDDAFNKSVHNIMLRNISWYSERIISEISLGGLLIIVVIRSITYNMSKMRDKYLHTNCLAALANMSGHFQNLHPYVCQRLVSLLETLAKRHARLCDNLRHSGDLLDATEHDISDVMIDVNVLEEVLQMILEILNSTLSNQLESNHNLVYTLLYKQHLFQPFLTHPTFQDVTQNIDVILSSLMERLETTKCDPGVADVQEVIKEGILHLQRDRIKKFPDLRFKYVEENDSEEFFIPYVWTLVYRNSGLYWNPSKIALFDLNQCDT